MCNAKIISELFCANDEYNEAILALGAKLVCNQGCEEGNHSENEYMHQMKLIKYIAYKLNSNGRLTLSPWMPEDEK